MSANKKVLLVTSSVNPNSASSAVARAALAAAGLSAAAEVDTAQKAPPAYDLALMGAVFMGDKSEGALAALSASDAYIEQLEASDILVLAVPMHNFGIPSGLKAWMDQVARPGRTFAYGANGPEGLLKGRKALVVLASGGDYRGAASSFDHASAQAKTFLSFLGLDVHVVHAASQAGAGAEAGRHGALEEATATLRAWSAE